MNAQATSKLACHRQPAVQKTTVFKPPDALLRSMMCPGEISSPCIDAEKEAFSIAAELLRDPDDLKRAAPPSGAAAGSSR